MPKSCMRIPLRGGEVTGILLRGGEVPSPAPTPGGDSHHGPVSRARHPERTGFHLSREIASPGSLPGHGFPAIIPTHCPRPWGAGEERGARAGWGDEGGVPRGMR